MQDSWALEGCIWEVWKALNKGYNMQIDIKNKLTVAFLCSFSIQGTKDMPRTADFKRP